ncbi:protein kinase family protein [Trujillonella endophytica]|uniref:Putative peptidoglycan lipid II flippase n=1 Tax=Trujillonella endophytica TaxID=673521 RepID=A0A1H8VAB3_9ACTN|nr:protein kinase family protein [Trujillella endophytica]SEP12345.1 putative peptidoglycan lipid II flippase [Trujillella endophytica]
MTSTVTGLPDRYRPIDEVGPEEATATGVIRCWRARDRVLNRDVAIRVHIPGGPAARAWIGRALTAGGLATPALAMVYDAAEGSGDAAAPGGAAYVVNEWIEGRTLAERLAEGPIPEREVRTVLRRLAEGVAEAHRVGLAVGGIGPDTVVLRPNGLVGLRAVPAASGTMQGDIAALGELLEYCLTGRQSDAPAADGRPPRPLLVAQPDLAALVRRARSTEPGAGLSSAAAMAALLAAPPRPSQSMHLIRDPEESDSGWLRRLRERREEDDVDDVDAGGPQRLGVGGLPPAPAYRDDDLRLDAAFGDEDEDDDAFDEALDDRRDDGFGETTDGERPARRRLVMIGLPLIALVVVVLLAWWFGTNVLSVADGTDDGSGTSAPPSSSVPQDSAPAEEPPTGELPAATIASSTLFNPQDSDPENDGDVPLTHDGDTGTAWSTVTYSSSPDFSGLKDGVGIVYDLGGDQALAAVTITTNTPGASMEVRVGGGPGADLAEWTVGASGTVDGSTELAFDEPVTTRYLLVWVTSLAETEGGFSADIAEVALRPAG